MPWYGSHSYLNEFIRKNKCRKILEIGVYNGENARNMVEAAIQSVPPQEVEYYGFDFFSYYSTSRVERRLDELGCRSRLFKGNTMDVNNAIISGFSNGGSEYSSARN